MSAHEIRLRCLELAIPNGISNPDTKQVLGRAAEYFRFVTEDTGAAPLDNGDAAENSDKTTRRRRRQQA